MVLMETMIPQGWQQETLVLQAGPHDDLASYCLYPNRDIVDADSAEGAELCAISSAVERMLESDTLADRMSAMHEVLAKRPNCGLAYAVMAREGASDDAQADTLIGWRLSFSGKNMRNLPMRRMILTMKARNSNRAILEDEGLILVAGEFARYLWRRGKRADAIQALQPMIAEFGDAADVLVFLSVSYLIQMDLMSSVSLIAKMPSSTDYWYYMKALLLFRAQGDTPVSRATLHQACLENRSMGRLLLGDPSESLNSSTDDSDHPEVLEFVADTKCAWHHTAKASEWLCQFVTGKIWVDCAMDKDMPAEAESSQD